MKILFIEYFLLSSFYCCILANLDAVILTVGKDSLVFEKSVQSALLYLVDIRFVYVICPSAIALEKRVGPALGPRVKFVDESIFPFSKSDVSRVMVDAVRTKGLYPLTGSSEFEKSLDGKGGWFFQQILKFYAGLVIPGLGDYVLLDGDLVWLKNVSFINRNATQQPNYFYATSSQYHADYFAVMKVVTGLDRADPAGVHRSGIVHHMVICKHVLQALFAMVETLHSSSSSASTPIPPIIRLNRTIAMTTTMTTTTSTSSLSSPLSSNLSFWEILMAASALQLTCAAPKNKLCGAGSTLSEYEIYLHYARQKFPDTVTLRPLAWANGPRPGMLYWPSQPGVSFNHGDRNSWTGFRHAQEANVSSFESAFFKQIEMDTRLGYSFIGYHSYAKRRYYELLQSDVISLCVAMDQLEGNGFTSTSATTSTTSSASTSSSSSLSLSSLNITSSCSWRGYLWNYDKEWWRGCLCRHMHHSH